MRQKSLSDLLKPKGGLLASLKKANLTTTATNGNDTGATAGSGDEVQERLEKLEAKLEQQAATQSQQMERLTQVRFGGALAMSRLLRSKLSGDASRRRLRTPHCPSAPPLAFVVLRSCTAQHRAAPPPPRHHPLPIPRPSVAPAGARGARRQVDG